MKKSILLLLSIALFSCGEKKSETPKDVYGYVVDKEIVKAHYDTMQPRILKGSVSPHVSPHVSVHSTPHVYSHSYAHHTSSYSHPMYRSYFHPVYHPWIYGVRPHTKPVTPEVTFIGTEFDVFVANKYSIHKVSVDSAVFQNLKRGMYVTFKDGKYVNRFE